MAAATEQETVREFLLKLIEGKNHELEKRGLLPKGQDRANGQNGRDENWRTTRSWT